MQILTTPRLRLRTWQEADFDTLYAILSDPFTMAHWPQPLSEADARAWFERSQAGMREHGYARWCCERLSDGRVIGDVGLVRMALGGNWINDLGYIIHADFWQKGFAGEAAAGIVEWARSRGLDKLVATMATDNEPSAAVARKIGMNLTHTFTNERNRDKETYWFELALDD